LILRLVFVAVLVIIFVVPIYNLLKRRTTRIKSELEEDGDIDQQLVTLNQKTKKLQKDCDEEIRSAEKRAAKARKTKKKL